MTNGPPQCGSTPACGNRRWRYGPWSRARNTGAHAAAAACLALLLTLTLAPGSARGQQGSIPEMVEGAFVPAAPASAKKKKKAPPEPTGPVPAASIPVEPLGFGPPAPFYLGSRVAQASLNFLDENTLLFTFRVPGLISRQHESTATAPAEEATTDPKHDERHVRALVLSLPSGRIVAEALWRLHDSSPYLRLLHDHRFLLRDRDSVQIGDAGLHLSPFLRFPGKITSIAIDPSEKILLANSVEPPARADSGQSVVASAASASIPSSDDKKAEGAEQSLMRIMSLESRKVMLFSRTEGNVRLALDGEGYYEASRGNGNRWMITYNDFHGGAIPIFQVESACSPALDVISPSVVLSSGCNAQGGRSLSLITRDKHRLWEATTPGTQVWPVLAKAENGLRIARATLEVSHPIGLNYALDNTDIRSQKIEVYNTADGKLVLNGPAQPILDGGGNFALSPSGKRFVVLNAGALQVYDLAAPPALPAQVPSGK